MRDGVAMSRVTSFVLVRLEGCRRLQRGSEEELPLEKAEVFRGLSCWEEGEGGGR
ncbi:hypothetical protein BCR35DRAFT_299916 [Leucosporidium creatinivorum]|uniref:Uncharacterized protein n=1 Tax=Leucosporidium creatinivorum TaxID=106004 RepID=A0A1Y2G288_9BASI|nr:hypothetical protein BCR35DRAFT_299916 [Leucosporidium creatinivorum]